MHFNADSRMLSDVVKKLNVGEEYFWSPDRLVPFEHWVGHIPFIFWLFKNFKPGRFVELGTHRGNSYCAMCQAVQRFNLASVGSAIDSWKGDIHMVPEPGLYEELAAYHDPKYQSFSTLLRTTFDLARDSFADKTIDLLHIDGTHTYEAVKHDFENWFPKLTDSALVLFHDIEVRRDDFGVWRLWEELKARYATFSFHHSHGLGVLAVGDIPNKEINLLFSKSEDHSFVATVRNLFSARGNALIDLLLKDELASSLSEAEMNFEARVSSLARENSVLTDSISRLTDALNSERKKLSVERRERIQQSEIAQLRSSQLIDERAHKFQLELSLNELRNSTSWRVTAPVREIVDRSPFLRKLIRQTIKAGWWTVTGQLRSRLKARREFLRQQGASSQVVKHAGSGIQAIPYYVDPKVPPQPEKYKRQSIAVHVHAFYSDVLDEILSRLASLPTEFDLFISVPNTVKWLNPSRLEKEIKEKLTYANDVIVKIVPNRGRDIAPFIVEFGDELLNYDIIGHFHTKKSPHNPELGDWQQLIFDCLFGGVNDTKHYLEHLLSMLDEDVKFISPQRFPYMEVHHNGWSGNREIAADILKNYTTLDIDDFPETVFAEGMMFWARSDALETFLRLPLTYDDFPEEPIGSDGTIAHALERIVFLLDGNKDKKILQIQRPDFTEKSDLYEDQRDYTSEIVRDDIKVLSYYLPQFHPIPENDEWHGLGFTEWTKVQAANPLFKGHYQQHVPHEDLGYYIIKNKEVLHKQASMMKKAGVYGQIFYHYWFSGRLILEGPSRILLDNKEIDMPFCFCWANENWTRRWDGSENEVLLAQVYSAEDAKNFISYLIPFFKDHRYIKVDGRPVLHVYRPSSITNIDEYLAIWRIECEKAGLERPFVVATLAAGASNPHDYGMDAGAERVLYDWTNGVVPEITAEVERYTEIEGRIFSYDSIADYYQAELHNDDFFRFPSIVPNWDNTPRYQRRAHVLHGSTPGRFQTWLEELIVRATNTLPSDRRFILVNAWNEWAEGAHLEPDARFGYAYLNSVGRALSKKPYKAPGQPAKVTHRLASAVRRAKANGSVLMVTHNWGGGVERHVHDMAKILRDDGVVTLLMQADPVGGDNLIVKEIMADREVAVATFSLDDDFSFLSELLTALSTRLVHVHHVIGLPMFFTDWLMLACSRAGIKYDVTLHDYFFICPKIHLVTTAGDYCGEPDAASCNECISKAGAPFGAKSIELWRSRSKKFLASARQCYVPDIDVANRLRKYFPFIEFLVRPHPEKRCDDNSLRMKKPRDRSQEQHVLVVGHMVAHKGSNLLYECAKYAKDNRIPLRFTVLGISDRIADFEALGNVKVTGNFTADQFLELVDSVDSGIAFFPTLIPETYSYALTEVVMAGFYPVAFDVGVIGSRLRGLGWGELISPDMRHNIPELVRRLMNVKRRPRTQSVEELLNGRAYPEVLSSYYQINSSIIDRRLEL